MPDREKINQRLSGILLVDSPPYSVQKLRALGLTSELAAFIAHAPADITALLRDLETAEGLLQRAGAVLKRANYRSYTQLSNEIQQYFSEGGKRDNSRERAL